MERTLKGESVEITIYPDMSFDVMLSEHKCNIRLDDKLQLIVLVHGRNTIDRGSSNNIIIDHSTCDISRLHLVIKNDNNEVLHLVDMSAHDTYVLLKFL